MKNLKLVGIITSVVGAIITLGIMYSTTSSAESLSDLLVTLGFYAWVLLPFAILIVLTSFIYRKGLSPAARVAILVTSILVVVSSVVLYWGSILNSESSTSALAFVFVPLYALAAIAVVFGLSLLLLRSLMPALRA